MAYEPKPPTQFIVDQQSAFLDTLPMGDRGDFEDSERGFVGRLDPYVARDDAGNVVWDSSTYDFLTDDLASDAPTTVNPSLWRQSKLAAIHGLYEVTTGVYQLRGMDLSNMSVIEGDTGVIVVDPLVTKETAAVAMELYRKHRGDRPVTGVIYTHPHVDHFGGVKGVVAEADVASGKVPVIAPSGFMEHAAIENVYAGTAMSRRSAYMFGAALARGPQGAVGAGLGQTVSTGEITLIAPTLEIHSTGQEETVDGVRIIFQMAPDTEAPAEIMFYLPDRKALCLAEDATHNLHNFLTLRGALVRDPHGWSNYLTETLDLWGGEAEFAFASHHWPTFGNENIRTFLAVQRDLYAYLHDQTLRMVNQGYTGPEIAEAIDGHLPETLWRAWSTHGYYGSVSHNVKAVYQRYIGWFDGNPAHLWQHTPENAATRYVDFMGGAEAVVEKARKSFEDGDYRWAAEVLNHVVFADPQHQAAKELLADTFEQLGYGAENGVWRNFFLSGTTELRDKPFGTPTVSNSGDLIAALTPPMLFDALAIQIDGPRAASENLTIQVNFTDADDEYRLRLHNGALTYSPRPQPDDADVTLSLPKGALLTLAAGDLSQETLEKAGIRIEGDASVLQTLLGLLDPGDPDFAIVTP